MFLGAAGGARQLPSAWCAAIPERARIERLAGRLAARGQPWVAVADLHGRRDRLEAVVEWADARMAHWRLALLGDYVDNGPEIPGLLDRILALRAQRGDDVVAIAGNHDVVCSRALETLGTEEGEAWAEKWRRGHWNLGGDTPSGYGADPGDVASLAARMPPAHREFLAALPWYFDTGRWLFVHAGLEAGPLAPQLGRLDGRPAGFGLHFEAGLDRGIPSYLRGHALDNTAAPEWGRVVVSAHSARHPAPAWEGPNRIGLQASDSPDQDVYAVCLPARTFLRLGPHGVEPLEVQSNADSNARR
jgi:hypothetical protein